jgi:hypothetical protein
MIRERLTEHAELVDLLAFTRPGQGNMTGART